MTDVTTLPFFAASARDSRAGKAAQAGGAAEAYAFPSERPLASSKAADAAPSGGRRASSDGPRPRFAMRAGDPNPSGDFISTATATQLRTYPTLAPRESTASNYFSGARVISLGPLLEPVAHPRPHRRSSLVAAPSAAYQLGLHRKSFTLGPGGDKGAPGYGLGFSSLDALSPVAQGVRSPDLGRSPLLGVPEAPPSVAAAARAVPQRPRSAHEDPLALLFWLSQADLSRFPTHTDHTDHEGHGDGDASVSAADFARLEADFAASVRQRRAPAPLPLPVLRQEAIVKRPPRPSPRPTGAAPSPLAASPRPASPSSHVRKGNPACGSCLTSSSPYWRVSWSPAFILCNACGLRYSKFKRYCNACAYVPRKEDKGATQCPHCASPWSYKAP